jgi:hypothetical protein
MMTWKHSVILIKIVIDFLVLAICNGWFGYKVISIDLWDDLLLHMFCNSIDSAIYFIKGIITRQGLCLDFSNGKEGLKDWWSVDYLK